MNRFAMAAPFTLIRIVFCVVAFGMVSGMAAPIADLARAEMIELGTSRDNTLFDSDLGDRSDALGDGMTAGRSFEFSLSRRRALIAFDLADAIPAGAVINSVALTLHGVQSHPNEFPVSLHRVTSDWGQGDSNATANPLPGRGKGFGAAATEGDPTWLHAFSDTDLWQTSGGDFVAAASATTMVGGPGVYTWQSTPELVADLQHWLNQPTESFGWLLMGDESQGGSAKRFATREHPAEENHPLLLIDFSPGATRLTGDTNDDGVVDLEDLNNVRNNFGAMATPVLGDTDEDGVVDLVDLNNVRNNFGAVRQAIAQPVPEPATSVLAAMALASLGLAGRVRRYYA